MSPALDVGLAAGDVVSAGLAAVDVVNAVIIIWKRYSYRNINTNDIGSTIVYTVKYNLHI